MINQSVKKLETKLAYMDDAYLKELKSHVLNIAEKGKLREIIWLFAVLYGCITHFLQVRYEL